MTIRTSLAALALLALGGCATFGSRGSFPADDTARPAENLPPRFEIVSSEALPGQPNTPVAQVACRSPLRDPLSGAQLTMVRSLEGRADYRVPEGAYGSRSKEYLRVDCRTFAGIGLVPQ